MIQKLANQMDGSMADTEHWRSYLKEKELPGTEQSSNDKAELTHLLNNPQPDVGEGESAASTGKKRRGRKPMQTLDERRANKIISDRKYRRGHKVKLLSLFLSSCFGLTIF